MLYRETVTPGLLELLKKLMLLNELNSFQLVGGTAISLQIGHRSSIDIDLFSNSRVNMNSIRAVFNRLFPNSLVTQTPDNLVLTIDGIRVELYDNWLIPFKTPPVIEEGIRLTALKDLAAFKLSAIAGRREKKDYIDLFFLFKKFGAAAILSDFKNYDPLLSAKSLLFALSEVETAYQNKSAMPDMIIPLDWKDLKRTMLEAAALNIDRNRILNHKKG